MKKLLLLVPMLLVALLSQAQAVATVSEKIYDFGDMKMGESKSHVFTIKNTGSQPLVLASVTPSCGCTVPEYTKDPIPPGGTGTINVTYTAKDPGVQNKTITVVSNSTAGTITINIMAHVAP